MLLVSDVAPIAANVLAADGKSPVIAICPQVANPVSRVCEPCSGFHVLGVLGKAGSGRPDVYRPTGLLSGHAGGHVAPVI